MRNRISTWLIVMIACLAAWFPAGRVFAENPATEQKQVPGLSIWSRTDLNSVKDSELVSIYRNADSSLLDQIREGLSARGFSVTVVEKERDIPADPARLVLVIGVDRIELGGKRPFGRTAKVKVSYAVQNKDRADLVRRSQEETSVQRWQNCIKKISEQVVSDVAADLVKNAAARNVEERHVQSKPTSSGSASEARLQELGSLKAKGLITEKEYETKRSEILNEL